jgi:hypothetical protein
LLLAWLSYPVNCLVLDSVLESKMLAASAGVGSEFGPSSITSSSACKLNNTADPLSEGPRLMTGSSG